MISQCHLAIRRLESLMLACPEVSWLLDSPYRLRGGVVCIEHLWGTPAPLACTNLIDISVNGVPIKLVRLSGLTDPTTYYIS